jgi:hypothetical protein
LHCVSNNEPTGGQFVDALKTIINGLAYTGLRNANCEHDDTELLDNLHSFLKESHATSSSPSTSHSADTFHDDLSGCHIVQQEANDDKTVFSVAYVSGFIARHLLLAVRCDDCKTCLTSPAMSISAFIYFKEYKDNEQSLTCPSERLVETVSSSVTMLEKMMADVAYAYSVEEKITAAIKNAFDGSCLLVFRFTTKR